MVDLGVDLFDAAACEGVMAGHCVFMKQSEEGFEIIYAGPVRSAPDCSGVLMFLNPLDFKRLQTITEKQRH
jgi:hypothetical protein